jgi:ATP-binding cassette, subfamily F, member 3
VILVSHDRRFLETVTTRTLSFTPDGVDTYEGGFKDYGDALERKRKADAEGKERAGRASSPPKTARQSAAPQAAPKPAPKPAPAPVDRDTRKTNSRELEKKKKRVGELEKQIADLESTLEGFREELKNTDGEKWERLHDLALKDREYSELLERAMKEWVTLSDDLAKLSSAETGVRQ